MSPRRRKPLVLAAAASSVVHGIHAAGSLVSPRRRKSLVPATSGTV
ncbi:hypothetical protein ACQP00_05170 [Dactylosporangium sp. CS-047395]